MTQVHATKLYDIMTTRTGRRAMDVYRDEGFGKVCVKKEKHVTDFY